MNATHTNITSTLPGKLIIFEWVDGSGKTTQALKLRWVLRKKEIPAIVSHWKSAPQFKKYFETQKNQKRGSIEPIASLILQAADLVYRLEKKIIPALEKGKTVILDRGLETIFARWYSIGLTHAQIDAGILWAVNSYYKKIFKEAEHVYFTIDEDVSLERLRERLDPHQHNISEGTLIDLHMVNQMTYNEAWEKMTLSKKRKLVNQIQRNMIRQYEEIHSEKKNIIKVDANQNRNQVHQQIISFL